MKLKFSLHKQVQTMISVHETGALELSLYFCFYFIYSLFVFCLKLFQDISTKILKLLLQTFRCSIGTLQITAYFSKQKKTLLHEHKWLVWVHVIPIVRQSTSPHFMKYWHVVWREFFSLCCLVAFQVLSTRHLTWLEVK